MCLEMTEDKCNPINYSIFFQISEKNIQNISTDIFSMCSVKVHRWGK